MPKKITPKCVGCGQRLDHAYIYAVLDAYPEKDYPPKRCQVCSDAVKAVLLARGESESVATYEGYYVL